MRISIQEICAFALATPRSRSFTGGENILNQGHLLNCGKISEENNCLKIIAFCLQSSSIRDDPHEIIGEVLKDKGKIVGINCSCASGKGAECKHVVATLLYLNRNDLESLKLISCTDKKCAWSAPKQAVLQQYDMNPLLSHRCLVEKINLARERKLRGKKQTNSIPEDLDVALQVIEGVNHMDLQETDNAGDVCDDSEPSINNTGNVMLQTDVYNEGEEFRHILITDNPSSALAMHILGRHDPLQAETNRVIISPDKMMAIIRNQEKSELLLKLKNFDIKFTPEECCRKILSRLSDDIKKICEETHELYSVWMKERQLRITASDAYKLYTYRKNQNPDWKKKSVDYFFGESFSNANTKYGLENESLAREAYEANMSVEVVECGLIISKENPWLGGSPDGIIFKNNEPHKIIEIKCPIEGKKTSADDAIKVVKWLEVQNGQVSLKKKHMYYAQIQIIMALVNVQFTDFVIYSSFDKSLKIIPISFGKKFAHDLLFSLKLIYFKSMLHNICEKKQEQPREE